MTQEFAGKVAIISGGASGIGLETGLMLAERGAKGIIIADFDSIAGKEAEVRQREAGAEALFIQTDVTSEDAVVSMVNETRKRFGRIDCLLNAAGGPVARNPTTDCSLETWEACFALNVRGSFLCAREVLKIMIEQGSGSIVNVSSAAAYLGNPGGSVHYAAAKGAILSMTKGMGREFAERGVRVNAISPGTFDTPFQDKWATSASREQILKKVPAGRMGDPKEAAELICFLLSDASRYITGEVIKIDGGLA